MNQKHSQDFLHELTAVELIFHGCFLFSFCTAEKGWIKISVKN